MPEALLIADAPAKAFVVWNDGQTILNLRGNPDDSEFADAVLRATGLGLPTVPCTQVSSDSRRIVWAGPDDWFLLASSTECEALESSLRTELHDQHHSVTDVSSGYAVARITGDGARSTLAQGCPLDLHRSAFGPASSAGSHFFKAPVWLWMSDGHSTFEVMVRSSFKGYVTQLLQRISHSS